MLSKLTGAAIHITFCIVYRVDSIVVRSVGYLKFIVKSIAMYVCLHGLCRQMLLFKMQDTITFLEAMRCKFRCMYFSARWFRSRVPNVWNHIRRESVKLILKKIQLFIKKINASVYKHKERLLWMENTKGRCENENLERCI